MTGRRKVALFGADGQVGRAVCRRARALGQDIASFTRADADLTEPVSLGAALARVGAAVVVNAAAFTAVDRAENEAERAFAVNRDGARNLAEACRAARVKLLHLSTDYVFDGAKTAPYREDDPIAPLGVYARSKAEGEAAVLAAAPDAIVLRTAWVYGLEGTNFVKTMLRLAGERERIGVVDDQRGSPTFADDLADAILAIAAHGEGKGSSSRAGIYHVAGSGAATWFELAREIFTLASPLGARTPGLDRIATGDYPTLARRPANSVLDCAKAKRDFGVELPPWRDGLARMLRALLNGRSGAS